MKESSIVTVSDDASATFRGFRHQALYVLSRILTDTDAAKRTYRPEGSEDLAVYDDHLNLIEAVQVKDHTAALSLSKLKPVFWERFQTRRKEWPNSETKLATFSGVGPELTRAIEGNAAERGKVLKKLCVDGGPFTKHEAEAMLDALNGRIIQPVALKLENSVLDALRSTNVGGSVKRAMELLMYWIFEASEHRRALTRFDLLAQLERIGVYFAALRDSSAEWGTNVSALSAKPLSENNKAEWTKDYRNGVQARWDHIVSGADCVRNERLAEIHGKLATFPVVIVRGASGQGKSTLGWRYMHDFVAEGLRFHVRRVESRTHASKIANALGDHARRLKLSAVVYVDVSPSDVGWSELLSELAAAGLKVLAAVREEDFRRANLSIGDFHFAEVALDHLTREEAAPIFEALHWSQSSAVLDFEEAWSLFNASAGGPLLEFTHLVTQGELLHSRINTQIVRLQKDAAAGNHGLTQKHIELLALAAVANETGARVSLSGLCAATELSPVSRPLRLLEAEYLLRLDTDRVGGAVAPLHALRSKAVVDSLLKEVPEAWLEYALLVLPHILDADIEPFLLAAFSRRSGHSDALIAVLNDLRPRSWTHAAGISSSLLWEGISRYEQRNRTSIVSAIEKYDIGWWMVCDSCVGSFNDLAKELRGTLGGQPIETVSLTPKTEVFTLFKEWVAGAVAPETCTTALDWRGAGDIAHWIGHCKSSGPMRVALESLLPDEFPDEMDVEHVASFISGRAKLSDAAFETWHTRITSDLTARFLRDTVSEYLADDGHNVTVYFSTPLADVVCKHDPKATDWHWQTMKRVRLLGMLFPNREIYSARGLGLSPLGLEHDPTLKNIPAKSMQSERATHLNAVFLALVALRHQRVDSWKQYSDAALKYRQTACECFKKLHRGWAKLLSANPPPSKAFKELPGAELDSLKLLGRLPMFPRCAVDEWGFVSENRDATSGASNQRQADLFRRFGAWRKAFGDFESGVGQVLSHILPTTVLFAAEHKSYCPTEEDEKTTRLSIINLASAWTALPKVQSEFRNRFGHLYSSAVLDELDKHEKSNFRHLWPAAFAMHYEREVRIPNFGMTKEREAEQLRADFLRNLVSEIEGVLGDSSVSLGCSPWILDDEPHLRIICNHLSVNSLNENRASVALAIRKACRFRKWQNMEWQPLVIEWPKLAVVHVLNGRALLPECVRLTSMTLFAMDQNSVPQQDHTLALPVDSQQFVSSGIPLTNNPLVERIFAFQGALVAFCITVPRFFELLEIVGKHDFQEADLERIVPRYSDELTLVWHQAQTEFEFLLNALTACGFSQASDWNERLHSICGKLLFAVSPDKSLTLTSDDFEDWSTRFESEFQRMNTLVADVLSTGESTRD
ncbi:MAG: hypothetical protein SynsKO_39210 [Synoicihabitans sp.]